MLFRSPIKKVRCFATLVKNPLHIRKHRDISKCEYKQDFHVVNDGNYIMAIYEGFDKNGKIKRSFELKNNIESAYILKHSIRINNPLSLVPETKNDLKFKHALKTGTLVLFWENDASEIWHLKKIDLIKRLYKVLKMNKDGRIVFRFHQEARNDERLKQDFKDQNQKEVPKDLTNGVSSINFEKPCPKLLLSPGNFNMLVEGYDFEIDVLGRIKPL